MKTQDLQQIENEHTQFKILSYIFVFTWVAMWISALITMSTIAWICSFVILIELCLYCTVTDVLRTRYEMRSYYLDILNEIDKLKKVKK